MCHGCVSRRSTLHLLLPLIWRLRQHGVGLGLERCQFLKPGGEELSFALGEPLFAALEAILGLGRVAEAMMARGQENKDRRLVAMYLQKAGTFPPSPVASGESAEAFGTVTADCSAALWKRSEPSSLGRRFALRRPFRTAIDEPVFPGCLGRSGTALMIQPLPLVAVLAQRLWCRCTLVEFQAKVVLTLRQ